MFIIELTYAAGLDQIDAAMKAHMRWLNAQYAAGHFVMSGRKIPRDGGISVAVGPGRAAIEAIAAEDPFVKSGLATARVIEFRVSQKAKDVAERIEAG